jgi:hypothetical protein
MNNCGNEKIEKERIIFVEGKEDRKFFGKILERLEITNSQIIVIGSKPEFKSKLLLYPKRPNFQKIVKRVSIIVDADESFKSTKESIENQVNNLKNKFKEEVENIKFDFFIMPNNRDSGMMETLCVLSVKDSMEMKYVNDFIEKIIKEKKIKIKQKNVDKIKAQIFLSIMPDVTCGMVYGIIKNYWNSNSKYFKDLLEFLYNKSIKYS